MTQKQHKTAPYVIQPGVIRGEIVVPGSKSISNRALVFGALHDGDLDISDMLFSDDTEVMIVALRKLGIDIDIDMAKKVVRVCGRGGVFSPCDESTVMDIHNAGTAMRFLTTLCCLSPKTQILTGDERMQQRPLTDLTDALIKNNVTLHFQQQYGYPPLEISATSLPGGDVYIRGDVSSQYISSLLLSLPYAKNSSRLVLQGEVVSHPYIDMTVEMMKMFGVHVVKEENIYSVPQGVYMMDVAKFSVEGDASSSTYPLAMAAIAGGEVEVKNIGLRSLQGDARFCTVLEKMGCEVEQTEKTTRVRGPKQKRLQAVEVNLDEMTDSFMTVCALAAVADGVTCITGIANQRVKECNRIEAMVKELGKCGVACRELVDGIEIQGSDPHGADIECYNDHRIAMSFAVLGCKVPGIKILDPDCTRKTYPTFWEDSEKFLGFDFV